MQLGLSGETLAAYARPWILDIQDITDFVQAQHRHVADRNDALLLTPHEEVYRPADPAIAAHLELDALPTTT